jgi:hypothetical protein
VHGEHGHGLVFGLGDQVEGLHGLGLVLRGVMEFQSIRGGQGRTWSKLKISMGSRFDSACKVFVNMAARKLLWNFGKIFGGM